MALVLPLQGQVRSETMTDRALLASIRSDSAGLTGAGPTIVLPTGALALADLPSKSVLIIDTLGRRVAALGGEGRAPGMLLSINALGAFGDSLIWVTDINGQRLAQWSWRSLRHVSSVSLERYAVVGYDKTDWLLYSFEASGHTVLTEYKIREKPTKSPVPGRLILRASNGATTLLGTYSFGPMMLPLAGGRTSTSFQPFSDNPVYGRSADGRRIVVIRRQTGPEGAVRVLWYDGRTGAADSAAVRLPLVRLTQRVVDSAAKAFTELVWRPIGYNSAAAALADVRAGLVTPTYRPPVGRIVVDRLGETVWLETVPKAGGQTEWLEFAFALKSVRRRVLLRRGEHMIASDAGVIWTAVELEDGEYMLERHRLAASPALR